MILRTKISSQLCTYIQIKIREKKFCDNIIDNNFFNHNLDLLLMSKLANFILFSKTFITLSILKPIYKIDQQTVLKNKILFVFQKNIGVLQDIK